MRDLYTDIDVKKTLDKPKWSINEGFSTIEGFTIKEFQGTLHHTYQAEVCVQDIITRQLTIDTNNDLDSNNQLDNLPLGAKLIYRFQIWHHYKQRKQQRVAI